MRYRWRSWAVAVVRWVAVALVWQGVVAAQDADARSGPAVSGELGATAGPLLYRSAPRMAPKVGAGRAGRALWMASVAALAAANVADAQSSWSKDEGNRVLAGAGGRFGAKGAALKGGINAVWIVGQVMALRRNPAHRTIAIVNFTAASVFGVLAYRNRNIPPPAGALR
jgi:hypothetical protein